MSAGFERKNKGGKKLRSKICGQKRRKRTEKENKVNV